MIYTIMLKHLKDIHHFPSVLKDIRAPEIAPLQILLDSCFLLTDLNIRTKSMCGQGLACMDAPTCIFTGIMVRYLYVDILKKTLLLFVQDAYPESHRLMADNDPKHNSHYARDFLVTNI